MSSSYRSSRLGLSHWDPYAKHRGGCLELCYCNILEWCWWDSCLIWKTNWFPSVIWHCWFGHMTCKNRPRNNLLCVEWDVKPLQSTLLLHHVPINAGCTEWAESRTLGRTAGLFYDLYHIDNVTMHDPVRPIFGTVCTMSCYTLCLWVTRPLGDFSWRILACCVDILSTDRWYLFLTHFTTAVL